MEFRRAYFPTFRIVSIFSAIALLALLPIAYAQTVNTITLMSGNGVVGGTDSANEFSTNGGATWNPAFIVAPGQFGYNANANYDTIPSTQYISGDLAGLMAYYSTTRYRTFFTLPANYHSPALSVEVHADNQAIVRLNGVVFGAQGLSGANFNNPTEKFVTAIPSLFHSGQNTLEIDVYNHTNQSALDYKANVSYVDGVPPGLSVCTNATIKGTPGNDAIVALGGPNTIDGMGGNDAIVTGPYNDIICGGQGKDSVSSGAGNDIVFGDAGDDRIDGGAGIGALFGGLGNDQMNGNTGINACVDTSGTNTFSQCP